MKKHMRKALFMVIFVALFLVVVSNAYAWPSRDSTNNAPTSWNNQYIQSVDFPNDVGLYNSIAWNPVEQVPFVSYYDAYNGDLMLSHYISPGGGNCGTGNSWYCEPIDTTGDVGAASSIDIRTNAFGTYTIGISYHDVTHDSLKFVSWTCNQLSCTVKTPVTIEIPFSASQSLGDYTSLRFNEDGKAFIAYNRTDTAAEDAVMIAAYVGVNGNCGEGAAEGKWDCEVIELAHGVGEYISLDLTYDGIPYLAYYDATTDDLIVAYDAGTADPACFDSNGWVCNVVDSTGDVGKFASITAQHQVGDQLFRVAYYDNTSHRLKYYDPSWGALYVDDMGTSLSPVGIAMDVDINNNPYIAYQKIASVSSPPTLMVAKPYRLFNDGQYGNCGALPPGQINQYWRCNPIDSAGQYLSEAGYVSMEISPSGSAQIAYSEFFNYSISNNATSLKYAAEILQHSLIPILLRP